MHVYVWLCMAMYEYILLCMTMFDYVFVCMTKYKGEKERERAILKSFHTLANN